MLMLPLPIAVDRAVPLPRQKHHRYPWYEMEVGDSFLATHAVKPADIGVAQVQRNSGMRFTTRRTNKGLRVWRIA